MDAVTYYDTNGAITGSYFGTRLDAADEQFLVGGVRRVEGIFDPADYYVRTSGADAPIAEPRPESPITRNGLFLNDVPAGTTLQIDGTTYPSVYGEIELEFSTPGTYSIRAICHPYKDFVDTVTV